MKIIDPHLHLFDLAKGDYQWLKTDNPPHWSDKHIINKNFNLDDLALNAPYELAGFVHIEAGFDNEQPWREIKWLTKVITATPFSAVAFIDITQPEETFKQHLKQLLAYDSVVGCRYILDDNACEILPKPQVLTNLAILSEHKLSFDIQMPLDDIQAVNELTKILTLMPKLQVIINHAGFPVAFNETIKKSDFKTLIAWQNWQQAINLLSRFDNCCIKCSGWEMTDRHYKSNWQQAVLTHCLLSFGQSRVMLASNFPLCLFNQSYQDYWRTILGELSQINSVCSLTKHNALNLSEPEQLLSALCFNNAKKHYKLLLNE
ncbi:amidohydrolase family protein [Colwellia sp. E2M01]|uniref:amidohydrolase family protein n=1 Tax=Colwellia sp. E2M01 TaxID=2841561 RepID=UPI001C096905|nr:amidohydrolase family protein [Colwellia sp. E2M01]MBU2869336.1 amidohydrolase family protein [Colwellia sp. E2M01]